MAVRFALYPVIAYLSAGAFFYFKQDTLLFPAPTTFAKTTPADSRLEFEDLRIPVNVTDYIHAWWIPNVTSSGKAILVLHGNGYVLEDMVEAEVANLHQIGANLLLVDYRGYGSSTPISPDEATVNEDAEAALSYLMRRRRMPAGKVFVLGRSIGSGPATHLGRNYSALGGLILESPFTSIDDAAAAGPWYFRIYPAGLILRTHFDNLSRISSVQSPLLIVSGTADTLTPAWMAERLFARAHQPKQLYFVRNAGHNDLSEIGGEALIQVLQRFLQMER